MGVYAVPGFDSLPLNGKLVLGGTKVRERKLGPGVVPGFFRFVIQLLASELSDQDDACGCGWAGERAVDAGAAVERIGTGCDRMKGWPMQHIIAPYPLNLQDLIFYGLAIGGPGPDIDLG